VDQGDAGRDRAVSGGEPGGGSDGAEDGGYAGVAATVACDILKGLKPESDVRLRAAVPRRWRF